MNTRALIGIVIALLILAGAFFYTHKAAAPVSDTGSSATATSTATSTPKGPTFTVLSETPIPAKPVPHTGTLDNPAMVTSSSRPHITGTAKNVDTVQVIIVDGAGVGIVGGLKTPVVDGRWEFVSPLKLAPGKYYVQVGGLDKDVTGTLTVTAG